jgi:hypothetical protein
MQPGGYRPALRHYQLALASHRDTCEITVYKLPFGNADLLAGVGDSAYEAPRLISFLDSLFRSGVASRGRNAPPISQWLRH